MRKVTALLVGIFLAWAVPAMAEADLRGLYVAPKFIVGIQKQSLEVNVPSGSSGSTSFTRTKVGGALAIGWDHGVKSEAKVRHELEYTYTGSATHSESGTLEPGVNGKIKAKVGVQSVMNNIYYDFHNSTRFTPYIGGGVGIAFVSTSMDMSASSGGTSISMNMNKKTKANFAWNIGLGCSFAATERVLFDLGYRYVSYGKGSSENMEIAGIDIPMNISARNVNMHQFMLGARIMF